MRERWRGRDMERREKKERGEKVYGDMEERKGIAVTGKGGKDEKGKV